jgi:hypothetical protein
VRVAKAQRCWRAQTETQRSEYMFLGSRKLKFQCMFSSLVVLLALLVTWLIAGESSPFNDYFIWHADLKNVWSITTAIPFILSGIISNNPHSPSIVIFMLALIIQWALVGFLLSIPISKLFGSIYSKSERSRNSAST